VSTIKPIFLLADSQLLFWRDEGELFLGRARALIDADAAAEHAGRSPRAAYLGASNGDAPEFYQLFLAAMDQIDVHDCRQIPAQPAAEDLDFLAAADLILLAGGEVRRGWDAFKAAGLDQKLVERYYSGALLLGVSAGAVQLGLKGWDETGERTSDMLRIVPFVVDVHDEPGWGRLLQAVPRAGEHARGIGIPSGGGALYHPDYSVEPVRHPLVEVSQAESGMQQALLLPGQAAGPAAEAAPPAEAASAAGAGPAAEPGSAKPEGQAGDGGRDPERERRELGYTIGADGVIEILRPGDPTGEPVN
jgi:Peptidase family S51